MRLVYHKIDNDEISCLRPKDDFTFDVRNYTPAQIGSIMKLIFPSVKMLQPKMNDPMCHQILELTRGQRNKSEEHYNEIYYARRKLFKKKHFLAPLFEKWFTSNKNQDVKRNIFSDIFKVEKKELAATNLDWSKEKHCVNFPTKLPEKFENDLLMAVPGKNFDKISGIQRLKLAFMPWLCNPYYNKKESLFYNFNWRYILKISLTCGLIVGLGKGAEHGFRYLKTFKKAKNSMVFESRAWARRERDDSFLRGLRRYTWRWGWRVTLLSMMFGTISQGMAIYRLKDTPVNYATAAFLSFGMYRWTRGPPAMLLSGLGGMAITLAMAPFCKRYHNPRIQEYFCTVEPQVNSPYYYRHQTEQQRDLYEQQIEYILQLMKTPINNDENLKKECEKIVGLFDPNLLN